MRQFIIVATAVACFACTTQADDDKAGPRPAPAIQSVRGTVGGEKADDKNGEKTNEGKKPPTRRERLIQIVKDQNVDWQKRTDSLNAMKPGAERDNATKELATAGIAFAQKALDLAREDENDAIAFSAAFYAFTGGGGSKTTSDAADFIAERLANDMHIFPTMRQMTHSRGGSDLLARIANNTKSKEIRGAALLAILDFEVDEIDQPPPGISLSPNEVSAKYAAATDKLKKLATDYAGVKAPTRLGDSVSDAARKKIFFIDHLTVGKKAPDFECELLDGKKGKLSDFSGNVVVLDVWTTWCTPCRAMIPHERALVEKLRGSPFKLVSVSADDEKETLIKFLEKEKMPWTHMWSGAVGSFIDEYQIGSYPTIFVIDAKGIIRFKHVRNEQMDHAVEMLLKEMSGSK
jgi:thiol-disulfide isomerase/thioredoxin